MVTFKTGFRADSSNLIRSFLLAFLLLTYALSNAQNRVAKTDESTTENKVTDIVVVFKMHVDIGYTN